MEKKNNTSKKEVIVSSRGSRECLYYVCLFSAAFIAAVALMIYAIVKENNGLAIYSYVLTPLFLFAALLALRAFFASANPVYTRSSYLFIKRFFFTRRINTEKIEKVTVATFGEDHRSSVKISYSGKAVKYSFKKLDKEAASKLRKLSK